VRTAFENGLVARIDVVSAESQIASDSALLPPLRQELSRAHHALSLILGRTPDAELPADLQLAQIALPFEVPVSLPSELAHRRPDILAAEARLHAATSAVGIAESNLYPKIQLTASVGQQAVTPGGLFDRSATAWSLLSGLTLPLFDGGTLRAQKRAAVDAMRASWKRFRMTPSNWPRKTRRSRPPRPILALPAPLIRRAMSAFCKSSMRSAPTNRRALAMLKPWRSAISIRCSCSWPSVVRRRGHLTGATQTTYDSSCLIIKTIFWSL
jgi:hypothetical protein